MMAQEVAGWSDVETALCRRAFERAYQRAVAGVIAAMQQRAGSIESVEGLWELHDFLSIQRHELEGRFDFRQEGRLFVFASLVKDGLLSLEELEGLDQEKMAKIAAMARM